MAGECRREPGEVGCRDRPRRTRVHSVSRGQQKYLTGGCRTEVRETAIRANARLTRMDLPRTVRLGLNGGCRAAGGARSGGVRLSVRRLGDAALGRPHAAKGGRELHISDRGVRCHSHTVLSSTRSRAGMCRNYLATTVRGATRLSAFTGAHFTRRTFKKGDPSC